MFVWLMERYSQAKHSEINGDTISLYWYKEVSHV